MRPVEHHRRCAKRCERGEQSDDILRCAAVKKVDIRRRPHMTVQPNGITADQQVVHAVRIQRMDEIAKILGERGMPNIIRSALPVGRHFAFCAGACCSAIESREALATAAKRAAAPAGGVGASCAASVDCSPTHVRRRRAARSDRPRSSSVGSGAPDGVTVTSMSCRSRNAVSSETLGRFPCSNSLMSRGLTPLCAASAAMETRRA